MSIKTFGIMANPKRKQTADAIMRIRDWLFSHNITCYLDENLSGIVKDGCNFLSRVDLVREADCIVTLGGDGTLLTTARVVGDSGVPILGINLGSLGFLTQQSEKALIESLERVLSGDFGIEKRMILSATADPPVDSNRVYALNDLVVDRGSLSRLIVIHLYADGDYVSSYRADGLIISTPTGSTAYNLAAGGPIVYPTMDAILISPICPHSLTLRPMVLSGGSMLNLEVDSPHGEASLTADGQTVYPLEKGHKIMIKAADFYVNLIRFSDSSFFDVLRRKLNMGRQPNIGI